MGDADSGLTEWTVQRLSEAELIEIERRADDLAGELEELFEQAEECKFASTELVDQIQDMNAACGDVHADVARLVEEIRGARRKAVAA